MPVLSEVKSAIRSWLGKISASDLKTPSDDPRKRSDVVDFVEALYEDAKNWKQQSLRARIGGIYNDPTKLWKDCRKLEQGRHYEVFGSRKDDKKNKWRHELVDNMVGDQARVRKSYLTANWHDISVTPNREYINDIINYERGQTGWHKNIILGTHRQLVEGTTIYKSIFDRSENLDGLAREIVCDNEAIFPSPGATGFKKIENCWHVIHATIKTLQSMAETYPNLDLDSVEVISSNRAADISMQSESNTFQSFGKTKFVDHIEVWMDDATLIRAEFNPADLQAELELIQTGQEVQPERGQNHLAFIDGYVTTIENLEGGKMAGTAEDQEFTQNFINYLLELASERRELMEKEEEEGVKVGRKRKYPFGRKIVVVGGKVAQDIPNPFDFDWRLLFNKADCESLPGHFWGRGLAEILWNTNDAANTFLSRMADFTVTAGTPKPYFSREDKEQDYMKDWSNDPSEPGFFTGTPPQFPHGVLPPELLQLYQVMVRKGTEAVGVKDVTYGEAPSKRASGELAKTLLRQNIVLVTGEASANQNDAIEGMVETRIRMYKSLYKDIRYYIINGKEVPLMLSKHLENFQTFEVNVKPNSNFPNQWDEEMQFVMQMATVPLVDGMPALPREAVIDQIAKQYPQWGRDSEYYQVSQVLQLGLQVMKAQQEQAARDANTTEQFEQKLRGQGIQEVVNAIGGGNGEGTQRTTAGG